MMEQTEELLHGLVMDLHGTEKVPFNGLMKTAMGGCSTSRPFRRLSMLTESWSTLGSLQTKLRIESG